MQGYGEGAESCAINDKIAFGTLYYYLVKLN